MNRKKSLFLSALLLGMLNFYPSSPASNEGFIESAKDDRSECLAKEIRHLNIGEEDAVVTSKIFVQTASRDSLYYFRFSTAVKGPIDRISYTRDALLDKEENVKEVSLVYEGIEANGNILYYSSMVDTENHLTEDASYKGEYYWACYTIQMTGESYEKYKDASFNIRLRVNDDVANEVSREITLKDALGKNDQRVISIGAGSTSLMDKYYTVIDGKIDVSNGALQNIQKGTVIQFYIFSDREAKNSDFILRGSSTMNDPNAGSGKPNKQEMKVNGSFALTKQDGTNMDIGDDCKFPAGNGWFDFGDVNLGKVDLHAGFNRFTLICENQQLCPDNAWRTPNVDSAKVIVDEDTTLICEAENYKSSAPDAMTPNFLVKKGSGNIKEGYIESMNSGGEGTYVPEKATQLSFYIFANKAIRQAELWISASSTNCPSEGSVKLDMQFNRIFQVTQGDEKTPLTIDDSVLIEGGGTGWFDWRDAHLLNVDLNEGYNILTFTCIGGIKDKDGTGSWRTPNIQSIALKF